MSGYKKDEFVRLKKLGFGYKDNILVLLEAK